MQIHSNKKDFLIGKTESEIKEIVSNLGLQPFRAAQIYDWIYNKRASDFAVMTNLDARTKELFSKSFSLQSLVLCDTKTNLKDDTIKFLFKTYDGLNIESVIIPSEARNDQNEPLRRTLCLSTQVGCPLDCKFCATGSMRLKRNLTVGEIVEQFILTEKFINEKLTNVVFMGMGEPLLNYDAVFGSIKILTEEKNNFVSAKRITVSTAGMVEGIIRMAEQEQKVKLALSLHALTNGLRDKLMPINRKHNLNEVMDALEFYYQQTKEVVTFEYILFEGLNDTKQDIKRLARLCRRFPTKVNVIPFHPINFTNPVGFAAELKPTSNTNFENFISELKLHDVQVMVRSSSGKDINAACGQLAISHSENKLS